MDYLNQLPEVEWVESCGAFRRRQETFSEFCFLVLTKNFKRVADYVKRFHGVINIVAETDRDITLSLKTGINLQLIKVGLENKGSGLIYHTGSTEHVKQLEDYAKEQGFILNQKGLFKDKIYEAGSDEHEIYNALGLGYIEPELREARDEIKAAEKNCLPPLIELDDIKGDLHSHTNETDGKEPLERMIVAAIEKGYEYFAITDHSKRLSITNGLNEERLLKQIDQINELNLLYPSFKILKSIEVDILEDGALDLSNEVLKELDLRVCSIHSKFKLPEQQQTERIIRAMDNPYFNILGHATGRLLKSRPPYPINIEKILLAAKDRGCYLELNAQPYRLDINDHYCKLAKDIGVKVAISSDAHAIQQLNYMQLGIYQARRGWLEKKDVLNCFSWPELQLLLKRN
ncbi:DNA polymerase/3'-5' exonuclease PolX [Legionella sp. km772]|uniref:DNA polymerase/3'-5' exonuclease PolX n=1 Tax=Legionella sp. km772 TaxID=2498111 RepID=UPI000F8C3DBA|nr:PHP domain-containing protein [Legionella sp. km772]RUR04528.1 PHP domain-containing protein [Legionella sp. km772]